MTQSENDNTDRKDHSQVSHAPIITTRPAAVLKNLSEMTIECSTDNPVLDTQSDGMKTSTIEKKVKSVFELPPSEVLINEFPCYIIRLVTLPGWLYLTTHYLCFYSSLKGKRKEGPYMSGYLSKKNHITSPRTYRHYFELQNHVLSWYESAESKYSPLGSVDLKVITRIEPSRSKKFGIRLHTKRHRYTIIADSEVSQKEWLDELKKGAFMAQQSGNSVRIVLPLSRIDGIEKPSVFQFAENIKVRLLESDDPNDPAEEYYFAFFPDIEAAFEQIVQTWKHTIIKDQPHQPVSTGSSTSTFSNLEGILGNISPAALPTLLIGKIMAVTNVFSNTSTVSEDHTDDTVDSENELELNQVPKNEPLYEKPEAKKSKRSSLLFFGNHAEEENDTQEKPIKNAQSPQSPQSPSPSPQSATDDDSQKKTKLHNRNSLTKIPAAVKEAIKNQVLRTDEDTSSTDQTPSVRRNRGSSFNTIRQISLSPFSLYNKKSSEFSLPPSSSGEHHELTAKSKTRHNRASSIGSFILNSRSKTLSKLGDHHKNDEQHSSIWVNRRLLKSAEQNLDEPFTLLSKLSNDDMMPDEMEEIQQHMNEQLNSYFPMLLQTESVQAAVKSTFWRTIPYSGKIYMTEKYFCFHSRVLTGQQRLIFPWSDVISAQRIISKNYLLYCGMTMTIKNMTEEIYFDFSSVELRDQCYALYLLKSANIHDTNSIHSKDSTPISMSGSSIILDRPEHISPPLEYDGPPLFSSSSNVSSLKYSPPSESLHITCLTIGSRGDVQPYIALCKELIKEGHTCRIATHAEYQSWIEGHGIEFRSLGGDPGELMKLCIDNSFLSVSFIREGTKFFYKWFEDLLVSSYEACIGTDLIIESPSAMVGIHTAEKLEIPYFRSMPFPFSRTAKFPHPFSMHSGSRIYNDMTYVMIDMALWAGTSKIVNRFRRKHLGLPSTNLDKLELWKVPYIYSFSPFVVHPPKDWPDYIHCTGYWFLDNPDHKWEPDVQLVQFLELSDARPIVYIGFGSIIVSDAVEVTRTIVEAVLKANVRAIICKGWSSRMDNHNNKDESDKISDDILKLHPNTIYQCDSVPHDWLFPKIQGVVHHGGAGTTAAGLRAGLPTVIKPFFGDQRFWGQRIEELQVGLSISKLTKEKLSEALITITQNKVMIKKAEAVGKSIRQENGVKNAIECIYREFNYAKQLRVRPGMSSTSHLRVVDEKNSLIESESDEEEEEEDEEEHKITQVEN